MATDGEGNNFRSLISGKVVLRFTNSSPLNIPHVQRLDIVAGEKNFIDYHTCVF